MTPRIVKKNPHRIYISCWNLILILSFSRCEGLKSFIIYWFCFTVILKFGDTNLENLWVDKRKYVRISVLDTTLIRYLSRFFDCSAHPNLSGHIWSVAKVALRFGCAKQSRNLERYLLCLYYLGIKWIAISWSRVTERYVIVTFYVHTPFL